MKKLFLLSLAAIMILSFAACGNSSSSTDATAVTAAGDASTATDATTATTAADVSLVDVDTTLGFSLKLPSDMAPQDANGVSVYVSPDKSDMAMFSVTDTDGAPLSEQTEDTYVTHLQSKYTDVTMNKFDNKAQIDGKDALIYEASLTTPAGKSITQTVATVVIDNKAYSVYFTYNSDNSSFLAQNVQACIDSITFTPAQ